MSSAEATPSLVAGPVKAVDIPAIERELARLWTPEEPAGGTQENVIRACMSNLLLFCANADEARTIPDEIGTIVRIHPCRVILLVADAAPASGRLEAFVSAHCHLSGEHGKICSEHITVNASGDAAPRLPSIARSLLLGDLPTSLWWASDESPSLGGELFDELEAMADQVVYSSLLWTEPAKSTLSTARWALGRDGERPFIADLAWRRLKPWRRLISQSLDPSAVQGFLDGITSARVVHGEPGLSQGWLLAGWLASRLDWRPIGGPSRNSQAGGWRFQSSHGPVTVSFESRDDGDPGVRSLTVSSNVESRPVSMSFSSTLPGRLSVSCEGIPTQPKTLIAPKLPRANLVGSQLQDLEPDAVFLDALRVARAFAEGSGRS
jgi:glucose-6-phosphate dehydrogenase assembly protein OpcA